MHCVRNALVADHGAKLNSKTVIKQRSTSRYSTPSSKQAALWLSIAQTPVAQLMFINDDATQLQMTVKQQITTVTVRCKYVTTRVAGDVWRVFMNHWTHAALYRQCWLSTSWPSVACCCDWRQMTQSVTLRRAVVPCRSSGCWTYVSVHHRLCRTVSVDDWQSTSPAGELMSRDRPGKTTQTITMHKTP